MKNFRYITFNFNRFILCKYWSYNEYIIAENIKYNSLKARIKKSIKGGLLGFKLKLSGRFSRKQRASLTWFSYGRVPLTTMNTIIDYDFFSAPIVNSLVTIKIWLHCSKSYKNYYLRMI